MMPRVVFDCMVFLQGAGRPAGPARACLQLVDDGAVMLCISAAILAEVRDVLTRPRVLQKFPTLSLEWVETFLRNVESKAVVLGNVPQAFRLERDPKDEPYLDLAIAAGATYLVSRDKDLLDLMNSDGFRQRFPDLTILDPVAFLRTITGSRPREPAAGSYPEQTQEGEPGN